MAPIDFIPKHNQPFTLEQAMLLEIDILVAEISRLNNSIAHLERTQEELLQFIRDDPDGDADGELGKAKEENDQVISSQRERITLIKIALMNKIGEGGIKHYGLDSKTPSAPPAPTIAPATASTTTPATESDSRRSDSATAPQSRAAETTDNTTSRAQPDDPAQANPTQSADSADSAEPGLYL